MGTVLQIAPRMEESSTESRVVCAGISAANDAIVRFMKDYKEKTFLELGNDLMRVATEVTGAVLTSLTQELSDEQGLDEAPCPHCGTVVARHSKAKGTLESRHGVTTVERAYYHCAKCKVGFVPFDEKVGLAPQRTQYVLQAAAAVFEQLTGMKMSAHICTASSAGWVRLRRRRLFCRLRVR
jgi:predicted RNA-binding Zn-ribbon protein involved in translation (DUF1610 family)